MIFRQTSFWRNYIKLYLQYMAVGVAAIPAGVLYAFLSSRGYETWLTALLAVAIGCVCARQAWQFVGRRFATAGRTLTAATATSIAYEMTQAGVPSTDLIELLVLAEWEMQTSNAVGTNNMQDGPATETPQSENNGLVRTHAYANG
jgi:hypothetical protein